MNLLTETAHLWVTMSLCALDWVCLKVGGPNLGLPMLGAAFYMGRELAQAEYRYIQANGGQRDEVPWYCGFLPEAWNKKGVLDWVGPLALAVLYELISGRAN